MISVNIRQLCVTIKLSERCAFFPPQSTSVLYSFTLRSGCIDYEFTMNTISVCWFYHSNLQMDFDLTQKSKVKMLWVLNLYWERPHTLILVSFRLVITLERFELSLVSQCEWTHKGPKDTSVVIINLIWMECLKIGAKVHR